MPYIYGICAFEDYFGRSKCRIEYFFMSLSKTEKLFRSSLRRLLMKMRHCMRDFRYRAHRWIIDCAFIAGILHQTVCSRLDILRK